MTFSLVARCAETGMFGVAIASSSPAVAARCAYARAGVGAVASQNVTDPRLGPRALELMALGAGAAETVAILAGIGPEMAFRQVLAVDGAGGAAVHSGPQALGIWADATGPGVACGGNLLADAGIPAAMARAFAAATGHLADRLLIAMRAAQGLGGEAGPIHSAGLKLVAEVPWPVADLRVDWTEGDPVAELAALWRLYAPQLDAYVTRALDPRQAPSYGVPGDE
jgi:uncharacterized Ntn-hydrolase superfamily protein